MLSYASQILTNIGREPSETSKLVTGSSVVRNASHMRRHMLFLVAPCGAKVVSASVFFTDESLSQALRLAQ